MSATKECNYCHELIHADAKKCRYCLSSQRKNFSGFFESAIPLLSIIIGLTSIATFLFVGAPAIGKQISYNKAIIKAELSGGMESKESGKYIDIIFINYGLKKAAISSAFSCYWHDASGSRVKDKTGQSHPEIFTSNSEDSTIDGETAKIIRFVSSGGLPLSEEELGSANLKSQTCQIPYTPLGDPNTQGRLQQFVDVSF